MKKVLFFSCFIISFNLLADENCCALDMPLNNKKFNSLNTLSSKINSTLVSPKCFNENLIKPNKGTPENQLKEMMKSLSDEEIYTRLIMAETLASTCPDKATSQSIAWVINNRIKAKNASRFGLNRDVVFKTYQFRSSTGDCDVAQRNIFMCPSLNTASWQKHWSMASESYKETLKAKNPIGESSYQYFFFKHFEKSKNCSKWKDVVPAWATSKNEVATQLLINKSCIKIYK